MNSDIIKAAMAGAQLRNNIKRLSETLNGSVLDGKLNRPRRKLKNKRAVEKKKAMKKG